MRWHHRARRRRAGILRRAAADHRGDTTQRPGRRAAWQLTGFALGGDGWRNRTPARSACRHWIATDAACAADRRDASPRLAVPSTCQPRRSQSPCNLRRPDADRSGAPSSPSFKRPPTAALAAARRARARASVHETTAASARLLRAAVYLHEQLLQRAPADARRDQRDARQPRPVDRASPRRATASRRRSSCRTAIRSRRTRRCARSAPSSWSTAGTSQEARARARPAEARSCTWCRASTPTWCARRRKLPDGFFEACADDPPEVVYVPIGLGSDRRLRRGALRCRARHAHRRCRLGARDRVPRQLPPLDAPSRRR